MEELTDSCGVLSRCPEAWLYGRNHNPLNTLRERTRFEIAEVPVAWRDVHGSKVHPIRDGWTMLRDLWELRRTFKMATRQSFPAAETEEGYPARAVAALEHESVKESRAEVFPLQHEVSLQSCPPNRDRPEMPTCGTPEQA